MSFLTDKYGKISIIRVMAILVVVGVLFVGFGFVTFTLDQNSRKGPLEITLPPGTAPLGTETVSNTERKVYYTLEGADADQIAVYFQREMDKFNGLNPDDPGLESILVLTRPENRLISADVATSRPLCNRFPPEGNFPEYQPGAPQQIPFYWSCLFDRSYWGATQFTEVQIHPGVPHPEPALNTEGKVVVLYIQKWQR